MLVGGRGCNCWLSRGFTLHGITGVCSSHPDDDTGGLSGRPPLRVGLSHRGRGSSQIPTRLIVFSWAAETVCWREFVAFALFRSSGQIFDSSGVDENIFILRAQRAEMGAEKDNILDMIHQRYINDH